jgi:hypothetical protein
VVQQCCLERVAAAIIARSGAALLLAHCDNPGEQLAELALQ